jgi:hypothetical protein
MSAPKLAFLGVVVAAALFSALLWQLDDGPTREERAAVQPDESRAAATAIESASRTVPLTTAAAPLPRAAEPAGTRSTEAELRARAAEESYARMGDVFVDYLVTRGLARVDADRVVRRFFDDSQRCLFDALRVEADAQAVAYDSVLDAIEADLHQTDGPLLGAVIDMRAVQNRVMPCSLTAAQQAGIEPSALPEATRAAILRRAQR